MDKNRILPYVEPILRFCCKRLANHHDAEDLASEILCHILAGMDKYEIQSLDGWVWRIAHNRYARFIDVRNKSRAMLAGEEELYSLADYTDLDGEDTEARYQSVFRYLHTLSAKYRDIFVDYYVGELPVKVLAEKYALPENTVKWRLNVGRQKIRDRIGEDKMDKVYRRINWNTTACNGNVDTDRYLHTQVARAICLAAYEKPLTVEEISLATGVPTMYLEDELPRLEMGDAVSRVGNKYLTDFIIFRLQDRKETETASASLIYALADCLQVALEKAGERLDTVDFYGNSLSMKRLGHIVVPYRLKQAIRRVKNDRLGLLSDPYPPRKDGGYGWFIVEETADGEESCPENRCGCNVTVDMGDRPARIYYYWLRPFSDYRVYEQGTRKMSQLAIASRAVNGVIPREALSREDAADLLAANLITHAGGGYSLGIPTFTEEQFEAFASLLDWDSETVDSILADWILAVRRSFTRFVPKHLHGQINQWIGHYVYQIVGDVTEELIHRGALSAPAPDVPFTDGIFRVEGKSILP